MEKLSGKPSVAAGVPTVPGPSVDPRADLKTLIPEMIRVYEGNDLVATLRLTRRVNDQRGFLARKLSRR
jgi:hypothetical protein